MSSRLVNLPRSMIVGLRAFGVDLDAAAVGLGFASASVELRPGQVDAVLDAALAGIDDPCFGLEAGARVRPELFGVAGFAAMSARTLEEAVRRLARYKTMLLTDTLAVERVRDGLCVQVTCGAGPIRAERLRTDAEVAALVGFARLVTGTQVIPLEVRVRGESRCPRARYEQVLGAPVKLGQRADEIVFSALDAARPLVSHAPELEDLMVARAERRLDSSADRPTERARAAIARALRGATPDVTRIAREIGVSARTLQRRLTADGTSFAALVDEVRRELACELLADTELSIDEVAYLVGFSRSSSLHRAFARWERTTPAEFRRRRCEPGAERVSIRST